MFGYVKPFMPELKIREYESFRTVYCGLCRTLGRRYAFGMRFILSYDLTVTAMLLLSLRGKAPVGRCRCPAKLWRSVPACVQGADLCFTADNAVLLFYHKLRDNLRDASLPKKLAAALLYPFAAWMARRAAARNPQAAAQIAAFTRAQRAAEEGGASIDAAADPTACMVRDLLLLGAGSRADARVLGRLGYFLGRWVYLMDAADDLEQDVKSGDYNPFVLAWGITAGGDFPAARARAAGLLNACVYEIQAAYALLPQGPYASVLENTFDYGLPDMQRAVVDGLPIRAGRPVRIERERKMEKHG